jgi:hypothetical protein
LRIENQISFLSKGILLKDETTMMELKNAFFCHSNYTWQLKKCYDYSNQLNVRPYKFVELLQEYFNWYYSEISIKGKKKTFQFIEQLKSSPRFKSNTEQLKFNIKNDEIQSFIYDMMVLNKKYFGHNKNDLCKHIHKVYANQYELNTIKYYLHEKIRQ